MSEHGAVTIDDVASDTVLKALSHETTFAGNFEATNCSAGHRATLVAHD